MRSLPTPLLLLTLPLILPSLAAPNEAITTRRDAEKASSGQSPAMGVKKMSLDEGEKFFWEYWSFNNGNGSLVEVPYKLPFPLHSDQTSEKRDGFGRYFNLKRKASGFSCPSGTKSCTSINRPNSCCATGETCQLITDSGLGDVGCCADGDNCAGGGGAIKCDDGYTSCPDNPGGGCCIPGYECRGEGCVIVRTATVTVRPTGTEGESTFTSTATSTSSRESTETETETESSTSSKTETETSTTQTDTQTIAPPIRPTTNPPSTITSEPSTTTSNPSICPTGFYACSAIYRGGCCRTGRDCQTTSCPTTSSTTIVNGNGKTIVVPVGDGVAAPTRTGSCAEGWFGCKEGEGGGCCPEGFGCERESCRATATGVPTGEVGKVAVEDGAVERVRARGLGVMGLCVLLGFVM